MTEEEISMQKKNRKIIQDVIVLFVTVISVLAFINGYENGRNDRDRAKQSSEVTITE